MMLGDRSVGFHKRLYPFIQMRRGEELDFLPASFFDSNWEFSEEKTPIRSLLHFFVSSFFVSALRLVWVLQSILEKTLTRIVLVDF